MSLHDQRDGTTPAALRWVGFGGYLAPVRQCTAPGVTAAPVVSYGRSTYPGVREVTAGCREPAVGPARRASGRSLPEQSKSTVLCSSRAPRWRFAQGHTRTAAHFYHDIRDLEFRYDVPA